VRRKDDRFQTRLGTQCEQCHRPTAWTTTSFNHAALSGMPLNASHRLVTCETCHVNANFRAPVAQCVSCHQKDYAATTSPNHAAAGFAVTCEICHKPSDSRWQGSGGFNHNSIFALVGVHATQPCASCHVNNVYQGTARTCVGCHQASYNASQNPNHIAAGFSTSCETCHRATDVTWAQGTFNHTRFPLTSNHNVACAQCHTTTNNFQVFSCTVCHGRAETDSKHQGRTGYIYDSNACYSCHPNGRAN
jgi:hypothetical protein